MTAASGDRSVAAGGSIGRVITGDHVTQVDHATMIPPEALELSACPPSLVNLPGRDGLFVGRGRELALLDEALRDTRGVVVQAVHGLGGIGKSTLAAHWAATRTGDHNPVWWITAETPADLDAGLAQLAVALQPALAGSLNQDALRAYAIRWLGAYEGWLLILDNVSDLADVAPLLARTTKGHFLITSRLAHHWHTVGARPVVLDILEPAEAVDLFTRIATHGGPRPTDGADELCAALGCLPLAVEQAAAYCAEAAVTPRAYLDLLTAYPADLYADAPEASDGRRTVARVWRLTLDRLADDPLTGRILRVLAWYAPDAVPRALLNGLAPLPAVLRALRRLAAHSMLTLHEDGTTVSLHRLVQALARTADAEDPHRRAGDIAEAYVFAVEALTGLAPRSGRDTGARKLGHALLPHVDALLDRQPGSATTDADGAADAAGTPAGTIDAAAADDAVDRLLGWAGGFLLMLRGNAQAVGYAERWLAHRERTRGEWHADTVQARNVLAHAYMTSHQARRAVPLHERTLAHRLRALGPDHPATLRSAGRLAQAYTYSGAPERGVALHERTLAGRTRVLGADHPATLASRGFLAQACLRAGQKERAVGLCERLVADRVRLNGPEHVDTLRARHHLAIMCAHAAGRERTVPLMKETLDDCVRVLGGEHPLTERVWKDLFRLGVVTPRPWLLSG
ncbi:tetratricopeptide repeat protein [Streptomyces sp. SP18CS02]|uniref:tetratricopeptide repeat protein n=1 Tax=Streptomyces sp. SP18CS02 TaxID=3002531 RepID=UPI002E75A272|nr:tetratricopeptide repeat protein [Streptomyces sp. SP18CS02]MEE1756776.1 tetratricopeptide repeat protein [Streptomyces sp. SP18CS02]